MSYSLFQHLEVRFPTAATGWISPPLQRLFELQLRPRIHQAWRAQCLISLPVKRQAVVNSSNTVFAFKRLMGHQFGEFTKYSECLVGLPAEQQAVVNSLNTVFAFRRARRLISLPAKRQAVVNSSNKGLTFKRLIGRQFGDKEVKDNNMGHMRHELSGNWWMRRGLSGNS